MRAADEVAADEVSEAAVDWGVLDVQMAASGVDSQNRRMARAASQGRPADTPIHQPNIPADTPMRPNTPAGPRPGTASADPHGGQLSHAAIVAAAHEDDPAKVYELQLRGSRIVTIENLAPFGKIRQLDLSGNQIARMEGLARLTTGDRDEELTPLAGVAIAHGLLG